MSYTGRMKYGNTFSAGVNEDLVKVEVNTKGSRIYFFLSGKDIKNLHAAITDFRRE